MKGQAFSVFKILIGSVFAVVLLTIVYQALSSYNSPISALDIIKNTLVQASNAPKKCFLAESVDISEGERIDKNSFSPIIVKSLAKASNVPATCAGTGCTFNSKIKIPVTALCDLDGCKIYFGYTTCP
jgi:hypothetical protein